MINHLDDILSTMQKFGGSFIKQLVVLYQHADSDNRRILEQSFAHYFQKYDEITSHRKVGV